MQCAGFRPVRRCILAAHDFHAHPGAPRRHPVRGCAGRHHLRRSRRNQRVGPLHPRGSGPLHHPDGLGVRSIRLGLRGVRDSGRLAGGQDRSPPRPDADRSVVVAVHGGHRLGVERGLPYRDPGAIRGGRGGRVPQHDAHVHDLAARERAQANLWLATRLTAAFTPVIVALLIQQVGWRRTFELFGLLGVIWAVLFYRWYRDVPSEHPAVNQAELAMLPPARDTAMAESGVPWGIIFSKRSVWLLSIQYMCLAYGWWFYINWLPTYLRTARGTTITMGALLAGLPLLMGGAGCLVSAWLIPRLARKLSSVALARRVVAV